MIVPYLTTYESERRKTMIFSMPNSNIFSYKQRRKPWKALTTGLSEVESFNQINIWFTGSSVFETLYTADYKTLKINNDKLYDRDYCIYSCWFYIYKWFRSIILVYNVLLRNNEYLYSRMHICITENVYRHYALHTLARYFRWLLVCIIWYTV